MARLQEMALARGNRGLLILAVLAGLVTAALVFVALGQGNDKGGSTISPATVSLAVVANQSIPAGTVITADMVSVKEIPEDLLVPGAFADTVPVVGEAARYPISKGEQVTSAKVGTEAGGNGLSYVVPKGKRAMAVEVREVTNIGGNLLTGDRVDVIVAIHEKVEQGAAARITVYTVLRDVEVLSVAQVAQEAVPVTTDETIDPASQLPTSGQLPEKVEEQPRAATVTLAVSPTQAQLLACLQDHPDVDRLWMDLRAFGEASAGEKTTVPAGCTLVNP